MRNSLVIKLTTVAFVLIANVAGNDLLMHKFRMLQGATDSASSGGDFVIPVIPDSESSGDSASSGDSSSSGEEPPLIFPSVDASYCPNFVEYLGRQGGTLDNIKAPKCTALKVPNVTPLADAIATKYSITDLIFMRDDIGTVDYGEGMTD
jgi:hypothetical protein